MATFLLEDLPYAHNALEPHISNETVEFHHDKHQNAYVNNLNNLIPGTPYENMGLDEIMLKADGGIFNNAAQIWNHQFYWHCLAPNGGGEPSGALLDAINTTFGSFKEFKDEFTNVAKSTFGSGWAWLLQAADGTLTIESTSNAGNPLTEGKTPLMTCDVWEHAYYIDYRNARPKYIEAFWELVNWEFIAQNFKA